MTIQVITDGATVINTDSVSDAPAVEISGDDVNFTNADGAVLVSTSDAQATVLLTGTGTTFTNALGARIEAYAGYLNAITGSAGSDTVENFGRIYGWVRLGDGDDSYVEHRDTAAPVSAAAVDLGAGNDSYTLINFPGQTLLPTVIGGTGEDTLTLSGPISLAYSSKFSGFERLILGAQVTNLDGFSGLLSLTLQPGGFNNFVQSVNPNLDVTLDGNSFGIGGGSSFASVTGGAGADTLSLNTSSYYPASQVGAVNLGGGTDKVFISVFDAGSPNPVFAGPVDGGAGNDDLVNITTRSSQTIDLGMFVNFEQLVLGTQVFNASVTARVINANGFQYIGPNTSLDSIAIAQSYSPQAQVFAPFRGKLTLEATTTVGSFGSIFGAYNPPNIAEIQASDPEYNLTVINAGTILGAVRLYIGNDLYDGSLGTTGGPIYGYAGDDILIGGAGDDVLDGGFGTDHLSGGAGGDTYIVDSTGDVVSEADNGGYDTILTDVRLTVAMNVERLAARDAAGTSALNLYGNGFANSLIGNAGANVLDGLAGADSMIGLGGNDVYFVDDSGDDVVEALGGGYDTVFANASYRLGDNVERVVTLDPSSTAAINFTGNALDNEMTGNAGANILDGGAGADLMVGGAGNDIYFVDNTGDVVSDAPDGGYDTVFTSTNFLLASLIERVVAVDGTSTVPITLSGNEFANEITGNAGTNLIDGKAGSDLLMGGGGADAFVFSTALGVNNIDALPDFVAGQDKIYLDHAIFAALGAGALSADAFKVGSGATDADDRIIYDPVTGALYYDADGNGSGAAVQFAVLHEGLGVTAGDFHVI